MRSGYRKSPAIDAALAPVIQRQLLDAAAHAQAQTQADDGAGVNRVSFKLKKKRVRNGPDQWVRRDGAFEPIVDPAVFYTARGIILERARRFTDEELLAKLRALLEAHGKLSVELIDDAENMPSSSVYQSRFGSIVRAYHRVSFDPGRDYGYAPATRPAPP